MWLSGHTKHASPPHPHANTYVTTVRQPLSAYPTKGMAATVRSFTKRLSPPSPDYLCKALIHCITHITQYTTNTTTINSTSGASPHSNRYYHGSKKMILQLGLAPNGLHPSHVGSHSLRAGGAMGMYLHGVPHDTVKKMGGWSSDTFLMYIHEQISAFSKNVSKTMSQPVEFHNIAFQTARAPALQTI